MITEYSVLQALPNDNQKVLCFGHKTYCCKEDMEENAEWHEAIFRFCISSYRLKKEMPEDLEESVLQEYSIREIWHVACDDFPERIIGVTKWKHVLN